MEDNASAEPVFRANKRRKIFRKRADATDDHSDSPTLNEQQLDGRQPTLNEDEKETVQFQRRDRMKKHGIAFTSSGNRKVEEEHDSQEMALVVLQPDEAQEAVPGDRFVKPTGRVAVAEDKHMMAYIDSKLAEVRSQTAANERLLAEATPGSRTSQDAVEEADISDALPSAVMQPTDRIHDPANARSTRSYQRPSKRRQKASRDEAGLARDSMIDQIMQEAQVPLYDHTTSASTYGDGIDNDAATADAYKAELIAELELRNRRRLAPKPTTKEAQAMSGPKLGGSRAQRERMKAAMESKAGNGKK